jgi:MFS family permease
MTAQEPQAAKGVPGTAAVDAACARVTRRLIPFLFACYVAAYLDRVNVGFAKLQMQSDLGFSDTVYGLGAGIFFIGYFAFEVPSNLIMQRVGARLWIARIMVTWGLVSASTLFVKSALAFYVLRFALGLAEAGFFPGVILYLTYWYPVHYRARVVALLFTAVPAAGVIGGPLSGWILKNLAGKQGWAGWQWLFLVEALPSVLLGFWALHRLKDRIEDAPWLNDQEKHLLEGMVRAEAASKPYRLFRQAFSDRKTWFLALVYFCLVTAIYALSFWLPQIVRSTGVTDLLLVGVLTAIPWMAGAIGTVRWGLHSDRGSERRWHIAAAALLGAGGLVASTWGSTSTVASVASMSVAAIGVLGAIPVFWTVPTSFLAGDAAAACIAWVNSIGNLGGFFAPYFVGWVKDVSHRTAPALYLISALLALGGLLVPLVVPKQARR